MYVKAMHPRYAHQLWEIPAGTTFRYGVITPPVGEGDKLTSDWSWTPLLHQHDVPAQELWVVGDPDVYTDGPDSEGREDPAARHYFIKWASWWDTARGLDVTVICGTDGDIFVMGENGKTIDKVA